MCLLYHARRMKGHIERRDATTPESHDLWQRRSDEPSKGQCTHRHISSSREWLERKHGNTDYHLARSSRGTVVVTCSICSVLSWMIRWIVQYAMAHQACDASLRKVRDRLKEPELSAGKEREPRGFSCGNAEVSSEIWKIQKELVKERKSIVQKTGSTSS